MGLLFQHQIYVSLFVSDTGECGLGRPSCICCVEVEWWKHCYKDGGRSPRVKAEGSIEPRARMTLKRTVPAASKDTAEIEEWK